MEFRGFDSSIILIIRGGILMSIGDFLESLSHAILVGIMLVGRLGVVIAARAKALSGREGPRAYYTIIINATILTNCYSL